MKISFRIRETKNLTLPDISKMQQQMLCNELTVLTPEEIHFTSGAPEIINEPQPS